MKQLIAILLILSNLLYACTSPNATPSAKTFSGQELFSGLYFGQGEVSEMLPEVWQHPEVTALKAQDGVPAKLKAVSQDLIKKIDQVNPDFFKNFAAGMQSGQHLKVQKTYEEGLKIIGSTMVVRSPTGEENLNAKACVLVVCVVAVVAVAYNVAVAASAVLFAVLYVAIAATKLAVGPGSVDSNGKNTDRLDNERLTNLIVERFTAQPINP
jgi:SdpC family antimicrobial peptide